MMVEVIISQNSILDFPKRQPVLNIYHSKDHDLEFSAHFYFRNDHVITSPANQLAIKKAH